MAAKKKNQKKGDGEKKEEGPKTVVLSVDMNCDGCTEKVMKYVKGFEGVVNVKEGRNSNKLTILGKVEPEELRDMVKRKTKKKVELISSLSQKANDGGGDKNSKKKPDDKKEATVRIVVLEIGLYCDGCFEETYREISKFKGVQTVDKPKYWVTVKGTMDGEKHWVTVKGTMNCGKLVRRLKDKLNKVVKIVSERADIGSPGAGSGTENPGAGPGTGSPGAGGAGPGTGSPGGAGGAGPGTGSPGAGGAGPGTGSSGAGPGTGSPGAGGAGPGYPYPQPYPSDENPNAQEHGIFIVCFYFILLLFSLGFWVRG